MNIVRNDEEANRARPVELVMYVRIRAGRDGDAVPVCYIAGMTIIEKFVAFAEGLPADRRAEIEEILFEIMEAETADCELSPEQLAELERRMADPNPQYASAEEVEAFFARYRTA